MKSPMGSRDASKMGQDFLRTRPAITITLDPVTIEMVDELAKPRALTRSSMIEQLIREAGITARLDMAKLEDKAKRRELRRAPGRPRRSAPR